MVTTKKQPKMKGGERPVWRGPDLDWGGMFPFFSAALGMQDRRGVLETGHRTFRPGLFCAVESLLLVG